MANALQKLLRLVEIILQRVLGKGWTNPLLTEPKDDNWSYGFGKAIILATLFATLIYFIIVSYETTANIQTLAALGLSSIFLIIMYLVADYNENHEKAGSVGFAFFGNKTSFLIQVLLGIILTSAVVLYMGYSTCAEPRLVAEGYCVNVGAQQAGILAPQNIIQSELALPFYGVILAPLTEELFFRAFLFLTLLKMLPKYFSLFKSWKQNYPILLFLVCTVLSSSAFGIWHYSISKATCSGGEFQCIMDSLFMHNIYGLFWTGGFMLTGGLGFSLVGHILNNMLGYKLAVPTLFIYVGIPLVVFGLVMYKILDILSKGKRKRV